MDLLRAVIVGAYGTPYQDGLFFFDFHLPPEYPDVPPVRLRNFSYVFIAPPSISFFWGKIFELDISFRTKV